MFYKETEVRVYFDLYMLMVTVISNVIKQFVMYMCIQANMCTK